MDQLGYLCRVQAYCPNITLENHQVTSKATTAYNCVAWVMGDEGRWWEPLPQYYWPIRADGDWSIKSYMDMFSSCGFESCPDDIPEPGMEKIAIYATNGQFAHVAMQLPLGRWTSKLGALEDIEHEDLEVLEGPIYGKVESFMKRDRQEWNLF